MWLTGRFYHGDVTSGCGTGQRYLSALIFPPADVLKAGN
jgi:hypothetical protein